MSIREEELNKITSTNEIHLMDTIRYQQMKLAWQDLIDGIQKWLVWLMLAYQDIKLRYRRSVIGPFWLTISMAITVYSMGYLYAHLFQVKLDVYFPFLTAGMLGWSLISTSVLEFTEGLTSYEALIKQIKLPYTTYMHRIISRNIMIFFHNIFVMLPVYFIYPLSAKLNIHTLFLLPGLVIIYFNAFTFGTILSMIGARYRDIAQAIKSLIQVIFFVTPVMWQPDILINKNHWIIDLNPFFAMLELLREPLLGNLPSLSVFLNLLFTSLIGVLFSAFLFIRHRARIVYWL